MTPTPTKLTVRRLPRPVPRWSPATVTTCASALCSQTCASRSLSVSGTVLQDPPADSEGRTSPLGPVLLQVNRVGTKKPESSMSAGYRVIAFSRRQPFRTMTMSKAVEAILGELQGRFPVTPTDRQSPAPRLRDALHRLQAVRAVRVAVRAGQTADPRSPAHCALACPVQSRKSGSCPWESSGTFLGIPAASASTSLKPLKGHSYRSTTCDGQTSQVTALAGLSRDI